MDFVPIDLKKLKCEYERTPSLRALAARYGTSKLTIRRKLTKIGVRTLSSTEAIQKIDLKKLSARRYDDTAILAGYREKPDVLELFDIRKVPELPKHRFVLDLL